MVWLRVALLPMKRLDIPCSALFGTPDVGAGSMRRLERALRRELEQLDDVEVLSPAQLRKRISQSASYREKILIGRERYLLGKELYEDLRQAEAEQNIQRAVELLGAIFYDLVEPDAFAERALHAVLRNRAIIVVPQWWKALWYLERVSPALSMRTAAVALRRTRQVQSAVTPK